MLLRFSALQSKNAASVASRLYYRSLARSIEEKEKNKLNSRTTVGWTMITSCWFADLKVLVKKSIRMRISGNINYKVFVKHKGICPIVHLSNICTIYSHEIATFMSWVHVIVIVYRIAHSLRNAQNVIAAPFRVERKQRIRIYSDTSSNQQVMNSNVFFKKSRFC